MIMVNLAWSVHFESKQQQMKPIRSDRSSQTSSHENKTSTISLDTVYLDRNWSQNVKRTSHFLAREGNFDFRSRCNERERITAVVHNPSKMRWVILLMHKLVDKNECTYGFSTSSLYYTWQVRRVAQLPQYIKKIRTIRKPTCFNNYSATESSLPPFISLRETITMYVVLPGQSLCCRATGKTRLQANCWIHTGFWFF